MNGPNLLPLLGALSVSSYNTRVVLLGASLLGLAAGVIGTFLLLRRKALIGDVVGHCALPGIAVAFLIIERMSPGAGKNLPALLLGATCAGLLGAQSVSLIRIFSRVDNDTALPVKAYHRLLVWDIMKKPLLTRLADQALNPLIGKSFVAYATKPRDAERVRP